MPKAKQERQERNKLSKYIKKRPKTDHTKRDNTYVFEGFYERLKAIDVKHSHAIETAFTYDKLLEERDIIEAGEDAELFRSNFIQLLRSEKANNKTVEFGKVYTDLEKYCFSYPLLVHNKGRIIERLLHYLEEKSAQDASMRLVQAGVVDLFIALIKDFRADIYNDFLTQIMPRVIAALDISNVTLVDKIFTLLSFAVKYLTRSIKEDITNFYSTYSELLAHKNKFVRKFAAQAFCYVVRKLPFDGKLLKVILKPLEGEIESELSARAQQKRVMDKVLGVSELLFEVAYGAGEGLHSKAKDVMVQVLSFQHENRSKEIILVIRSLYQKLVNEVDTEKHQDIYDGLTKTLDWTDNHDDLQLLLSIFRDCIKLKFGRRVSHYGIVAITECLNALLNHNGLQKTAQLTLQTKLDIAETLSLVYYFKHNQVLSLFAKSSIDFSSAKHLFNHHIYQLATASNQDSLTIVKAYMSLFTGSNVEVSTTVYSSDQVDWSKILGLKQSSNNQMEFSKDSHRQKLQLLIKSFNKYLLKQILICGNTKEVIELMAMFELLACQMEDKLIIEIGKDDLEGKLVSLFQASLSLQEQFVLNQFISRCKSKVDGALVKHVQSLNTKKKGLKISLKEETNAFEEAVQKNFILKNYSLNSESIENMRKTTEAILDLNNRGSSSKIDQQIKALQQTFLSRNSQSHDAQKLIVLLKENPSDIVTLKAFNSLQADIKLSVKDDAQLFNKLSENLMKNQREIRIQSLKALSTKFEKLLSKLTTEENQLYSDVIDQMLVFEQLDITFMAEKARILQIERIKASIENESVPDEYLSVCYNFLVGVFWIRFTPLYDKTQQTIQILIREHPDKFVKQHFQLLENLNYLTQLAHDNQTLINIMTENDSEAHKDDTLVNKSFLRETQLSEDFMDVKDFFYNIGKSLCIATIMDSKDFRPLIFNIFYNFIDCEYTTLYFSRQSGNRSQSKIEDDKLLDNMTYANMIDSEDYKKYRRQAYAKLYCFLELLQRAESLKKIPQVGEFQELMLRLLNTSDTKLQKIALECILKSDSKGVLKQYRKLLEGFTDDLKFKDMVQVVNFGSQVGSGGNEGGATIEEEGASKKDKGANIPKLAESHRLDVLPIVIKLLLSKLIKKKGAINQKTVHTRRTIVYQFMSQLNPQTELKLFFNDLLLNFDVLIDDEIVTDDSKQHELRAHLSKASFSNYLNFIGSFSIIIKQMGSLLTKNGYLERITKVFTQILSLTKRFIKHLKLSIADEGKEEKSLFEEEQVEKSDIDSDSDMEVDEGQQNKDEVDVKDSLYRFVGHQSKICMRKGLGIVKQLYEKYNHLPAYVQSYSQQVYREIIEDQLVSLNSNFISDRSQMLEVLTISWTQTSTVLHNYLTFPKVFPTLMAMLSEPKINPEVYELHLQILESIIMKSIQGLEDKKDLAFLYKKGSKNIEDDPNLIDGGQDREFLRIQAEERDISQTLLKTYIDVIAKNLNVFCSNHLADLKKTLITKTSNRKRHIPGVTHKPTAHEIKNQTIKDLIFVMSEVANYLESGDGLNQNFLEMIVSILSMKNLHTDSAAFHNSYYEELLHFGCKSLINLLTKLPSIEDKLIDKILQLFLSLRSLRIRQSLSQGLLTSLPQISQVSGSVLETVAALNKLKRGAADLELDYDSVIKTIQSLLEIEDVSTLSNIELQAISYSVIFLLHSEEFSVRDFASHFIKVILFERGLQGRGNAQQLIAVLEQVFLRGLTRIHQDEMILKTILDTIRHYVTFLKKFHSDEQQFKSHFLSLSPLVNLKDDNDDFFASFLAIKMKSRQKALRMISNRLPLVNNYKAIQTIVMPLVNYVVFGDRAQKSNRRNTISYNREEKRATLEDALDVYEALARTLKWPDYFRLLKNLLFKLTRIQAKSALTQTESYSDDDLLQQEKTVVKCLCRVLNGFHFEGIPDALEAFLQKDEKELIRADNQTANDGLGDGLEEVFKKVAEQDVVPIDEVDSEEEDNANEDEDVKMTSEESESAAEIQKKLIQKVLPILERHMTDAPNSKSEDPPVIRAFVVISIAKTLRKLPLHTFQHQLQKLISFIVSRGLRQKDIACRDKGRKALLKLLEELTPRKQTLTLVFQEMKEQLQKGGYQLHTFVFSVHFLLQQLHEKKLIKAGDVSTNVVEMLGDKFLEELFNSNSGADATLEDMEKVKIKESKSKKAIPVFEMFSQFIDFKSSFFTLIAPMVRTLEENPSITKIQMCEELLNRISTSLLRNESIKAEELLMFTYTIIQRGISMAVKVKINDDRGVERDYGAKKKDIFLKTKEEYKEMTYSVEMKWAKTGQQLNDKKTQEICGRVLGSFGLQCLKRALKQTSIILKPQVEQSGDQPMSKQELTEDLRAKLDPFVPVLLDAFRTYHNPIIVTTLHVLGQLIPLDLPSFKDLMKKFLSKIFKLFETTSSSSDQDFLNSLFRCTSELIRTYATYQDLTQPQVRTLVHIIKQHLSSSSTQSNVFQCLRAIVYRKFVCSDLYDLIENVQEMMITSIAKSTRTVCASIFTQFLLEYPLESARVEQHINHLVKNLGYFDSEGRLQLLDVINSLIERFPRELLDQYSELIFFTLILRTVNESNAKCRERVLQVVKRLILRSSQAKSKTLFNTVLQMGAAEGNAQKKLSLSQAKQMILGVFIDSFGVQIKTNDAQKIYDQCLHAIQEDSLRLVEENENYKKSKEQNSDTEEDEEDDGKLQNPDMASFLKNIDLMEDEGGIKQIVRQVQVFAADFDEEMHQADWSPLYHSLTNMEKLISQTQGDKPSQVSVNLISNHQNSANLIPNILLVGLHHKIYWIRLAAQRVFGAVFSLQLKADIDIKNALGLNEKKDLLHILYKMMSIFKFRPMVTEELGTQLVKNLTFLLKHAISDDDIRTHLTLQKLFARCSFVARKMMLNVSEAKDRIAHVLLFFQVALHLFEQSVPQDDDNELSRRDNEHSRAVLGPVLELVYRIYTDDQYAESRAKELALELVDYLSTGLDKTYFINSYNEVKQGIHKKRIERKRQQKIMMASSEGAKIKEKRRERKAEKKKEKRRAKILQFELRKN